MRVAVVEFNTYHDEILPSVVYALNELGIRPDVYLRGSVARRRPFTTAPSLWYRRRSIDGRGRVGRTAARLRGTPARYGRYEAVFLNSTEPASSLEAAARFSQPVIAVVHNASLLENDPAHREFFATRRHLPIVLARHIAERRAHGGEPLPWLAPVYLGDEIEPAPAPPGVTRVCVQGNIEPVRRDYEALLAAAAELAGERSDFVIHMVGRASSVVGRAFRQEVEDRGLSERFSFNQRAVSHRAYRSQVAGSDFLLPLVHADVPHLRPYFESKLTSSMSAAIALGVIPVAEAGLLDLYGVRDGAVAYAPGGLVAGLRAALDTTSAERAAKVATLGRAREDALAASVRNLSAALGRLGVRRL